MKQVTIKSVGIEGFGSYVAPFTFNMERKGINILRASNGTGKTTVFSAMVWALFGVNLKGVTKDKVSTWKHKRPKGFQGTRVVEYLNIDGAEITIARHIKYKGQTNGMTGGDTLMVGANGDLISTGKSIDETQELINELVGLDGKLFLNSVMFAQRSKKFINASNTEKREVLEQVFNLDWVSQAAEIAKKEGLRIQTDIDLLNAQYRQQEGPYTAALSAYNVNNANIQQNKLRVANELQQITSDIQQATQDLEAKRLLLASNNSDQVKVEVEELKKTILTMETDLAHAKEELTLLQVAEQGLNSTRSMLNMAVSNTELILNRNKETLGRSQQELAEIQAGKAEAIKGYKDSITGCQTREAELKTALDMVNAEKIPVEFSTELCRQQCSNLDRVKQTIESDLASYTKEIEKLDHNLAHITDPCSHCGAIPLPEQIEGLKERINAAKKTWTDLQGPAELAKQSTIDEREVWGNHLQAALLYDEQAKQVVELDINITTCASNATIFEHELQQLTSGVREIELGKDIENLQNSISSQEKTIADAQAQMTQLAIQSKQTTIDQLIASNRLTEATLSGYKYQLEQKNITLLSLASALSDITNLEGKIKELWSREHSRDEEHDALCTMEQDLGKEYTRLLTLYNELGQTKERLTALETDKDRYKWWQSVGFGTSGIKSLVFSVMLTRLNEAMAIYSQRLGVSARFVVDMDKARKDIEVEVLKDGHIVGYDCLSGGEAQRIDIISLCGMHDLISATDVMLNILVLDEVFEGLDAEGVEAVFNLIAYKQQSTPNVFIITHAQELSVVNANIIDLEYELQN